MTAAMLAATIMAIAMTQCVNVSSVLAPDGMVAMVANEVVVTSSISVNKFVVVVVVVVVVVLCVCVCVCVHIYQRARGRGGEQKGESKRVKSTQRVYSSTLKTPYLFTNNYLHFT